MVQPWMQSIIDIKESIKEAMREENFPPYVQLKMLNLANELVYIIDGIEEENEFVVKD